MKKQDPKCEIGFDEIKEWWLNGKFHREDGPAVEYADGTKFWYLHGELHREDGPAVECSDGEKGWYLNGEIHREDGPALEWPDGTKQWWLNGNLYYHNKQTKHEQVQGLVRWLTALERARKRKQQNK